MNQIGEASNNLLCIVMVQTVLIQFVKVNIKLISTSMNSYNQLFDVSTNARNTGILSLRTIKTRMWNSFYSDLHKHLFILIGFQSLIWRIWNHHARNFDGHRLQNATNQFSSFTFIWSEKNFMWFLVQWLTVMKIRITMKYLHKSWIK